MPHKVFCLKALPPKLLPARAAKTNKNEKKGTPMPHHETHLAAATLNAELTATRNFFDRIAAVVKERVANTLIFGNSRKKRGHDVFEDLYYPNEKALRH